MRSERKQEIAKAKLKKARQQLNVQANPQQVQVGGGAIAHKNLDHNLLKQWLHQQDPLQSHHHKLLYREKHKWGDRLGFQTEAKPSSKCSATSGTSSSSGTQEKSTSPKPPVARSKIKNQPAPTPVAATDLEADVTAPVDAEYDTDELAELPTDSDSEAVESEQGEDPAQLEGQ